jgi:hypothetical protein
MSMIDNYNEKKQIKAITLEEAYKQYTEKHNERFSRRPKSKSDYRNFSYFILSLNMKGTSIL